MANANSYASLTEFANYAAAHLYATAHTGSDDSTREKALAMATRVIDANWEFIGRRAKGSQGLEWPRTFCDSRNWPRGFVASQSEFIPQPFEGYLVPRRLKDATCEMALSLLTSDRTADAETAGIAELGLGQGAIEVKFDAEDRPGVFPSTVEQLLEPLGRMRGSSGAVRIFRT